MYGREMIKVICIVALSPIVDFIADVLMLSMAMELMMNFTIMMTSKSSLQ